MLRIDRTTDAPWDPPYQRRVQDEIVDMTRDVEPTFSLGVNIDRCNGTRTRVPKHPLEVVGGAILKSHAERDEREEKQRIRWNDLEGIAQRFQGADRINALVNLIDDSAPGYFMLPKRQHLRFRESFPDMKRSTSADDALPLSQAMDQYVDEHNESSWHTSLERIAQVIKRIPGSDTWPSNKLGWSLCAAVRIPLARALRNLDMGVELSEFAPNEKLQIERAIMKEQLDNVVIGVLRHVYE